MVLLLLSYGADASLQDALGRTARDWAIGREGKLRVLDFEPPDGFAQTLTASRLMWIDAISINQEDTQERNLQVVIMSEIYSRGTRCGWSLGRARRL